MTSLWSSDLHLNEVARDSYRWEILPWLEKTATEHGVDFIGLGGDTSDAKDRHPASFVNRLTDFFAKSNHQWWILAGNHDYIDPATPFFRYLDHFENVHLVIEPEAAMLPAGAKKAPVLMLPATKEWETLWPPHLDDFFEYIFMHGTFAGTKSETGFEIPGGIPVKDFFFREGFAHLYAGDIHTPGKIADRMEYIGAPYRVHFGDVYQSRAVLLGKHGAKDLHPPMRNRHVVLVRGPEDLEKFSEVRPKDQVKLRVRLKRSEFPEWRKIRAMVMAEAEQLGWEVCGIELLELSVVRRRIGEEPQSRVNAGKKTPEEYLQAYATSQKWKKPVVDFGLTLLNGE